MVAPTAPCRLYLQVPPVLSAGLDGALRDALEGSELACVLRCGFAAAADLDWDMRLRELTDARHVALLVENDTERAERIGADGVHLAADAPLYRRARDHLGERATIGVGCIETRHDAMLMAELGADYVAFGLLPGESGHERRAELIAWWAELFEVPCVAFDIETAAEAGQLAGLGADFVAPSLAIWQAEDASQRIAAIGAAIQQARTAA